MLTSKEVHRVRALLRRGLPYRSIEAASGVSLSKVYQIATGRYRVHRRRARGPQRAVPAIPDERYAVCERQPCPKCRATIVLKSRFTGLCVACDVKRDVERAARRMFLRD